MEPIEVIISGPKNLSGTYKNIQVKDGIPLQNLLNLANSIYHIKWDYNLNGRTITFPENSVLKMEGGSITNGTLIGINTILYYDTPKNKSFVDITFAGGWEEVNNEKLKFDEARISNLENWSTETDTRIESDEGRISNLESGLNETNTRITTDEEHIANLESGLNETNTRIESDEEHISNLETLLNETNTRIGSDEERITTLENWLTETDTRITTDELHIAELEVLINLVNDTIKIDPTLNKLVYWNGTKLVEPDGATAGVRRYGTSEQRPEGEDVYIGFQYFDTELNKIIYVKNIDDEVMWIDANGNPVETVYAINESLDDYLLKTDANDTYLSKVSADNKYLTKTDAASTYLTKVDAANTYLTEHQDISGKVDKVTNAVAGHLAVFTADGNLTDIEFNN